MKKIFLIITLLFQSTILLGQVKTVNKKGYGMATGDFKPNRQETPNQNNNTNYTERSYQNSCYTGFAFTVKNYGYSKMGNHYSWGIKVKNNYTRAVSLRYKLIVGNDNTSPIANYGTLTYNIKPGETYHNDFGTMMALIVSNSSDKYRIEVSDVCFEGQDCIKNGYADCNGKQTKIPINSSSSNNITHDNSGSGYNEAPHKRLTSQDLENSLSKSQEEKIKNFREFFIQNGYKFLKEGKKPDDYTGYIIEFSDFLIQLYYESEDENVGANGNGIGSPVIKIRLNSETSKNKVLKLLNSLLNRIDVNNLTIIII